jgi:hypothetical protein
MIKYVVRLTEEERTALTEVIRPLRFDPLTGKVVTARTLTVAVFRSDAAPALGPGHFPGADMRKGATSRARHLERTGLMLDLLAEGKFDRSTRRIPPEVLAAFGQAGSIDQIRPCTS